MILHLQKEVTAFCIVLIVNFSRMMISQPLSAPIRRNFKRVGRTIKQTDNWSCYICCLQMLTLADRDEVLQMVRRRNNSRSLRGVGLRDAIFLLDKYDMFVGFFIVTDKTFDDDKLSIDVLLELEDRPAMLVVEAVRFKGKRHGVFWDGRVIRDPNPDKPETCKLSDYKVFEIEPITFYNNKSFNRFNNFYK